VTRVFGDAGCLPPNSLPLATAYGPALRSSLTALLAFGDGWAWSLERTCLSGGMSRAIPKK
jgi:hypothetical protein